MRIYTNENRAYTARSFIVRGQLTLLIPPATGYSSRGNVEQKFYRKLHDSSVHFHLYDVSYVRMFDLRCDGVTLKVEGRGTVFICSHIAVYHSNCSRTEGNEVYLSAIFPGEDETQRYFGD